MKLNLFIVIILFISKHCLAQTGSIKIYSEINNYSIYVDDSLIGQDLKRIETVKIGQHYIKATINNVIIHSELISVYKDSMILILLKSTNETKIATLESMVTEKQEYKLNYLRVKEKTIYVNNTNTSTSNSPTIFDPNRKITTSTTTSTPNEDFSIVNSVEEKITLVEFSKIINDSVAIQYYDQKIALRNDNRNQRKVIGAIGLLGMVGGVIAALSDKSNIQVVKAGSIVACGGLLLFAIGTNKPQPYEEYYTPAQLIEKTQEYNLNLKKKLNLPLDYEPISEIKN
jgi:hypothetical protein